MPPYDSLITIEDRGTVEFVIYYHGDDPSFHMTFSSLTEVREWHEHVGLAIERAVKNREELDEMTKRLDQITDDLKGDSG